MIFVASKKPAAVHLLIAASCFALVSVAKGSYSEYLPIGVPLDVFEFVPTGEYSYLPPSYITFYALNNGFNIPEGYPQDYSGTIAAYDIFTPQGEIYDYNVGAYDELANAFYYGGYANWTGSGELVYGGGEYPAAYDGSASVSSMQLEFYSPFVLPDERFYATLTATSISDYFYQDADPMETGSWIYDPNGFGNPVSSVPDSTSTLMLLTLSFIGLAGVCRCRRIIL